MKLINHRNVHVYRTLVRRRCFIETANSLAKEKVKQVAYYVRRLAWR